MKWIIAFLLALPMWVNANTKLTVIDMTEAEYNKLMDKVKKQKASNKKLSKSRKAKKKNKSIAQR